jgi:hypothetical protein
MDKLTPSQCCEVDFGNGKVIKMNRAQRRQNKLYGKYLTKVNKNA